MRDRVACVHAFHLEDYKAMFPDLRVRQFERNFLAEMGVPKKFYRTMRLRYGFDAHAGYYSTRKNASR